MSNETKGHALADLPQVSDKVGALDQVLHELTDAKRSEWRPRQKAAVARRLGRFEDGIKRSSIKPPAL